MATQQAKRRKQDPVAAAGVPHHDVSRIIRGEHDAPHAVLGAHPVQDGVVVRAFHPDATAAEILVAGKAYPCDEIDGGLFATVIAGASLPLAYRVRFAFANGATWEREDPYRFLPTLGDMDLHLFNEGKHRSLYNVMGAHVRVLDGVQGVAFAVWAPNARRVSVVGDFCHWDGRIFPMRQLGSSGVYELFIPGVAAGALYKFEIKTNAGAIRIKADPFGQYMELPPGTASRVTTSSYVWGDGGWMTARTTRNMHREPMSIYEVHLGSWARVTEEMNRPLTYRELAVKLVDHVKKLGFTHIELMPIAEHPFSGSWGYQVSGYYAPTARYGTPDDFRYFVDVCHQNGIGVILDWVPAHFPKDDFALARFDGTALFEHEDPRRGEHPDWGTLIFNYGRNEVRAFLLANALYWFKEFHIDGLRVDAVASILYLDYSRKEGEWLPNQYGGRENLEAVSFLRELNSVVYQEAPGCMMIAEESTAWGGVSGPQEHGGLGFTFKWNMGWMHDTLKFFQKDPVHRQFHHDELTFAMIYEYTERFIMPLSHDEVVHGKGSLLSRMPGDNWQRFANLRLLLSYQFTRPGKILLFMGAELAQEREWNHEQSLDWHLLGDPMRQAYYRFVGDLCAVYRATPALWRDDHDPHGYVWIDGGDRHNSVLTYARRTGDQHVIVVLNLTPVPRTDYRIGALQKGHYVERFSSDRPEYGGSQVPTPRDLWTDEVPWHGQAQSLNLQLPPLGCLVLEPVE